MYVPVLKFSKRVGGRSETEGRDGALGLGVDGQVMIVSVLSSAGCHNSLVHKGQKVVQRSLSDVYEFSPIPDSQVEGIDILEGKWENEQEVIDSLWERMEWFLLKVTPREFEELPGTILKSISKRV